MATIGSKKTLLVTCATGNVGHSILRLLCSEEHRHQFIIRAGCFLESEKSHIQELPKCDVCKYDASIFNKDLDNAFMGIDYAFLIPSRSPDRVNHIKNYVEACKKNDVKFILLFSMIRSQTSQSRWGDDYDQVERIVEQSGIPYTFVRTTLHQQTLFLFTPDICNNALPLPIKDGRVAITHTRDIAHVVRVILEVPEKHYGKAYHITGPELLSGHDMARIASEALKRSIRFVNVTPMGARKLMIESGLTETLADEFLELFGEIADGHFEFSTAELFRSLTGQLGTTLYDFFVEHRNRFTQSAKELPIKAAPEGVPEPISEKTPSSYSSSRTQVVVSMGTELSGTRPIQETVVVSQSTPERNTDRSKLEQLVSTMQRWVFQEEGLVGHLNEMRESELGRMKAYADHLNEMSRIEGQRLRAFQESHDDLKKHLAETIGK